MELSIPQCIIRAVGLGKQTTVIVFLITSQENGENIYRESLRLGILKGLQGLHHLDTHVHYADGPTQSLLL